MIDEELIINDIQSIMENIIKIDYLDFPLISKNREFEMKEMVFILSKQIHTLKKKRLKNLINEIYKNLKEDIKYHNLETGIIQDIQIMKTSEVNIEKKPCNIMKQMEDFKENLKNISYQDYEYCNQICNNWENLNNEEKIKYLTNQIEYLQNIPQPEQRSEEWYHFRNSMLTASDLYKAIGTEGIRRTLIIKKSKTEVQTFSGGGDAIKHGIKYEDVAISIYEKMKKVKIFDYGCIKDKEFDIFGASPDGICGEGSGDLIGRMLEIKCPTSRQIIEGKVPDMYWKQIQGQLEVCKLWECDFFECKITECIDEEEFNKSEKEKGIVIDIKYNDTGKKEYIYAPLNIFPDNYYEWLNTEKDKIINDDNIICLKISYWELQEMNCVTVQRDPYWFYSIKPHIKKFWDEVLYYRENGCEVLEKKIKKKQKKNKEIDLSNCIIYSDSE